LGASDIAWHGMLAAYAVLIVSLLLLRITRVRLARELLVAVARMSLQLYLVGFYLSALFELNSPLVNVAWVLVMVAAANLSLLRGSGLSLRLFFVTYPALLLAVGLVLAYFMLLVFTPDPVLDARYVIPVAGMLLGNSMNRAIITLERFYSDIRADQAGYVSLVAMGATLREATAPYLATAYRAGLAPSLANTANIGLVFLPGMMTGQILGGSEPMTAIEYQIAIILAIFVTTELASLLAIRFSMIRGFGDLGFLDPSVFR
jgi:putative ABC transport system permease protein